MSLKIHKSLRNFQCWCCVCALVRCCPGGFWVMEDNEINWGLVAIARVHSEALTCSIGCLVTVAARVSRDEGPKDRAGWRAHHSPVSWLGCLSFLPAHNKQTEAAAGPVCHPGGRRGAERSGAEGRSGWARSPSARTSSAHQSALSHLRLCHRDALSTYPRGRNRCGDTL